MILHDESLKPFMDAAIAENTYRIELEMAMGDPSTIAKEIR